MASGVVKNTTLHNVGDVGDNSLVIGFLICYFFFQIYFWVRKYSICYNITKEIRDLVPFKILYYIHSHTLCLVLSYLISQHFVSFTSDTHSSSVWSYVLYDIILCLDTVRSRSYCMQFSDVEPISIIFNCLKTRTVGQMASYI